MYQKYKSALGSVTTVIIQRKFTISYEDKYCDNYIQPLVLSQHYYTEHVSFCYILHAEYI
jgi:hypothetical protein